MRLIRKELRTGGLSSVLMLALLPLVGCSGEVERRWSEEVGLADGAIIVVDRLVRFTESNSIAGDAYRSTTLKSALSFRGDLANLPKWDFPLEPLVLYRDEATKEWVVVATTNSCDVWSDWGSPSSPYWEFRQRNEKWVKVDLTQASIGRETNLFFDYEPKLTASKLTRELKTQAIRGKAFAEEYRRIDTSIGSNCTPRAD